MAQTKTKQTNAKPKSRSSSSRKSGSRGKTQARKSSRAKAPSGKQRPGRNGASRSNGSRGLMQAASKAKVPLMAGGAALVGAAGGMAYGASHSGGRVLGVKMPRPKRVQLRSRDLRKAARDVGTFGDQVGQLAGELRRTREEGDGGSHASPIEVLLRGLTTRR